MCILLFICWLGIYLGIGFFLVSINVELSSEMAGILLILTAPLGLLLYSWIGASIEDIKEKKEKEKRKRKRNWEAERQERNTWLLEQEEIRKAAELKQSEIEKKKREIERRGILISIHYEESNSGFLEDVSEKKLGYDILSNRNGIDRYIEVKAKDGIGDILITKNEWETGKKLRNNYFLYVIFKCSQYTSDLYIIKDPFNILSAKYDSDSGKYIVSADEIFNKGVKK